LPASTLRPLLWPFVILLMVSLMLAGLALRQTDGTWVYPLDDSYIHLSLARELATHGHWGFGAERTAFSSSSPGYTLLLALGFQLTGPWAGWPLLLNGLGLLLLISQSWRLWPPFPGKGWLWLLLMLLLPVPLLWLVGLEHLLHLGFMLGAMRVLSRVLAEQGVAPHGWLWVLGATLLRYETVFLIAVAGGALLWQRRWRSAWWLGMAGVLPLLSVGAWSVLQGGTWLPLSVLLKGHAPLSLAWLSAAVERLYQNPFMLTTLVAVLLGLSRIAEQNSPPYHWLWLTFGVGLLQVLFAEVGGYRYEAYWLGLAWLGLGQRMEILGPAIAEYKKRLSDWALMGLLLFPLLVRSGFFLWHYPQATRNIYQQPYQVAQFLQTYYPHRAVGLNDIGLGSWQGDIDLTDMVGVGDQAVFDLRQRDRFTAEALDSLLAARGVQAIVGHEIWLGSRMPARFRAVGTWAVPDNFILADDTITFWATPAEAARLEARLRAFAAQLPSAVRIDYSPKAEFADPPPASPPG
jgi:hypothetical protein